MGIAMAGILMAVCTAIFNVEERRCDRGCKAAPALQLLASKSRGGELRTNR
jgi:hypothetical protein